MEFEFDKEMDAILRKARSGEVATFPGAHMDADEITAFAENAVPAAARQGFAAHLADCMRCRKILSNTILLNSEAATETASSVVSVPVTEQKVPWYRRLFVFPQLAYAMGAMVLLFSGFFGYLILKNLPGANEVSFSTNKSAPSADQSRPQAAPTGLSSSNANAANSAPPFDPLAPANKAANAPVTTSATPSFPNSDTAPTTLPVPIDKGRNEELDRPASEDQPQATPNAEVMTKSADSDTKLAKDETADKNPAKMPAPTEANKPSTAGAVRQEKQQNAERKRDDNLDTIDGRSGDDEIRPQPKAKTNRAEPDNKKKEAYRAGETRSVGGKTFNNVGGIWFDSDYTSQKQKNFKRGTSDYLRLDSGLRSIADQLGGTVVILWGGKAYRIQ